MMTPTYYGPPVKTQLNCMVQDANGVAREVPCGVQAGILTPAVVTVPTSAAIPAAQPAAVAVQGEINWLPLIAIGIGIYLLTKN